MQGTEVKREGKMKTFSIKMVVFCLAMFFYATSSYSDLIYSTYLGGIDNDSYVRTAMTVDADGNVYVAGYTFSSDFPTTPGAIDESYNDSSNADAFITKFDPTGTELLWSTYLGGNGDDACTAIAVDTDGNVYVVGYTGSANFPTTPGAYDTSFNGESDVFITKLDPTGTYLIFSTYLGGVEGDRGYGIAIDADGNVYVVGYTGSTNFPTTPGAYDSSLNGVDVFITKLDPTGSYLIYSTYLGGVEADYGIGIVIDADGNAYVTGCTDSYDFPTTPGAYDTSYNEQRNVFITKINSTGTTLLYSTYLGGGGGYERNIGRGIAVDSEGNAFVTGNASRSFPTTPGAYNTVGEEVFVTKLNSTGTDLVYSTYLTGEELRGEPQPLVFGSGEAIAVDADGNAYVVGYIYWIEFPTTLGAYDASFNGDSSAYGYGDAFVTKLNSTGTGLIYSTYLGGSEYDRGLAVAIDAAGNVWVAGATDSYNFPTTPDAYDASYDGGGDVFISKISILVGLITSTTGTAGGGTIDPEPGTYIFNEGAEVTITATPNSGHIFSNWSGDASETNNPIIITMDSDKSITANFTAKSNGDGNGDGKKGGCFIATAAYGSQLHPHLDILRDFRDRYLMAKKFGRMLVSFYYKYSPFVAELIANNKVLKVIVKSNLLPFVVFSYSLLHFGSVITAIMLALIFMLQILLISFFRRKIRQR